MSNYVRKEIREFIDRMPKEMKLPRHWKKFVNKSGKKFNLLLKSRKKYFCTNCKKEFYTMKQDEDVGSKAQCPFCKNTYMIKGSNIKNYRFLYDLAMIDNFENKIVIRYFEVLRTYNCKKKTFDEDVAEYARIIPEMRLYLVNNRYTKFMMTERVDHFEKIKSWRVFTGFNGLNQYYISMYLDNIEEKTKGTIYQYAPIKEVIEYIEEKNIRMSIEDLFKKAKFKNFELLVKMNLMELAIGNPEEYEREGAFEKKFGLSKKYLRFMQFHDISFEELEILKIIKTPNIEIIHDFLEWSDENIEDLKTLKDYVDVFELKDYSVNQKGFSVINYLDYINNLNRLQIPLTKKKLFPKDFKDSHDELSKKVEVITTKELMEKTKYRYKELEHNIFKDKEYFIRPAKSLEDLKDEGIQQNHCVYSSYSSQYANGKTDIYFLREVANPDKSLVTVEVKDNKIRQKYGKNNSLPNEKENKFLYNWEENVIKKAA